MTRRSDVRSTRVGSFPVAPLEKGEALLEVEKFALTANNITYAAFGDAMRYWDFFPTGEPEWGLMPVWGFATVRASTVPELAEGDRFYGYFPMADVLRVRPGRFSERGFYDMTEYRQPLPSPYNQYTRCSTDAAYVPELEEHQMLLRPLFFTSYMLADFLQDNAFFGASQIVISSGSSKTAYGTAFSLREFSEHPTVVALTSRGNRAYVDRLGLYDRSVAYEELSSLPASEPTVYVDFSGKPSLREDIHAHFAASLVHDCYAGSAANTDFLTDAERFEPTPQPFFAPDQIRKRNKDWGPEVLAERFGATQRRFLEMVADPAKGWMRIEAGKGYDDAARIIDTLCETGGSPEVGYTIAL